MKYKNEMKNLNQKMKNGIGNLHKIKFEVLKWLKLNKKYN